MCFSEQCCLLIFSIWNQNVERESIRYPLWTCCTIKCTPETFMCNRIKSGLWLRAISVMGSCFWIGYTTIIVVYDRCFIFFVFVLPRMHFGAHVYMLYWHNDLLIDITTCTVCSMSISSAFGGNVFCFSGGNQNIYQRPGENHPAWSGNLSYPTCWHWESNPGSTGVKPVLYQLN